MKRLISSWVFMIIVCMLACNDNKNGSTTNESITDSLRFRDTIDVEAASVKSDDYYDTFENTFDTLIGCWAAIREGSITISFSKDSTFEFYDYNSNLKETELLTGRFELNNNLLTLFYNDRPKQRFSFKRDSQGNNEYCITNSSGYYFLKSHCQ